MDIKKLLYTAAFAIAAQCAAAAGISPVGIDSISFDRHGDYMVLDMDLDLTPTHVQSSRAQVLTPLIVSAQGDTLQLPSVGVYGRLRYMNYLRNGSAPLSRGEETAFRASERPDAFSYEATVPFSDWMTDSRLLIRRRLFGCTDCLLEERTDTVTRYFFKNPAIPEIIYFEATDTGPVIETLEGAAYIDFVVDKTDINPTYRRNPQELMKISASIDTVLNDPDVRITGVWLKGFASPESPYAHNTDLAIGRTKALKEHIRQLYNFDPDIITTDYEPEDWAGLRRAVAASNIDNREEILALIDSDMAPDPKEALIKKRFPKEYKFMLDNFYPALRHTEYRITYEVVRFDDLAKIRQVMRTRPSRLTLREFFLLGNACTPGSDEFNEVYETAVRVYPDNPVANINAANAALQRRDFVSAEKYLKRAGDSPEADYARGSLSFSLGDYDSAELYLRDLTSMPAAREILDEIARIRANEVEEVTSITLE